ncbi:transcriptional coactivator p15/PC4 family protein [Methylobacterium sp. A54F]
MTQARTIAIVTKNALEEVRVSLSTFNGYDLVDVRTFADFDGSGGEKRPTRKGISLKREKLGELIAALQAADEASR